MFLMSGSCNVFQEVLDIWAFNASVKHRAKWSGDIDMAEDQVEKSVTEPAWS